MTAELRTRWLGRVAFNDALALQDQLVQKKQRDPDAPDELFLLEHDPVYTIGRTPDRSSLRDPAHLPHPLVEINRGGQATFHGPGQLVGYPIIDLRRQGQDLHRYLRALEALLIEFLTGFRLTATSRPGLTGVWIDERKIASIGIGVRHWITMHGFALNVCGDLAPFTQIVPCGIANVCMTSIEKETGRRWEVEETANRFGELACSRLGELLSIRAPAGAEVSSTTAATIL